MPAIHSRTNPPAPSPYPPSLPRRRRGPRRPPRPARTTRFAATFSPRHTDPVPIFRRRGGKRDGGGGEGVLSEADQVWNRATQMDAGPNRAAGDIALRALLSVHSLAMNGGLLHSVVNHSQEELEEAAAGYRYFGLGDAAEVVESVVRRAAAIDLDVDPDAAERLEAEADDRYAAVIPDDSTLADRFERLFRQRPEAFAPLR